MESRYLEDYVPGSVEETRSVVVTPEELRSFAQRYDPQPIHIDEAAATASPYGGLITSGWHTASMAMRLVVDDLIDGRSSLGSPGLGPIRWLIPVRAGDTLRVRMRVVDARPSQSKPDRGTVVLEAAVLNQRDETVMTISEWIAIIRRRPA